MYNCGMCGRPTNNPQAICELCMKAKNRNQIREARRDEREERSNFKEDWNKGEEEKEESVADVWAKDDSVWDLHHHKKPRK